MAARPKRYDGLQVLRAMAVLLVIWTHLKHAGDFSGVNWLQNYAGGAGVDIFFVISGFVICISAENLKFDAKKFFINRVTRIAPLYWLTSLPLIAVALLKGKELDWKSVANAFTFLPFFDTFNLTVPINNFGWTLSFEFWFYTIFSIMLAFSGRQAWRWVTLTLFTGSAVVWVFYDADYYLPKFLFNPLVFEFLAGVFIYKNLDRLGAKVAVAAAVAVLFLAWLSYGAGGKPDYFGNYTADYAAAAWRALIWGGLGVASVLLVVALDNLSLVAWPNWALKMGDYSYSIYIVQPYTLWMAVNVGKRLSLDPWASGMVFVVSTILIGSVMSIAIEGRITKMARNRLAHLINKPVPPFVAVRGE